MGIYEGFFKHNRSHLVVELFYWKDTPQGYEYWLNVSTKRERLTDQIKELAYNNLNGFERKLVDTFWTPIALTDEEIWE